MIVVTAATAQMPTELPRVLSQIRELDVEQAALESEAGLALTEHIQKAAKQVHITPSRCTQPLAGAHNL